MMSSLTKSEKDQIKKARKRTKQLLDRVRDARHNKARHQVRQCFKSFEFRLAAVDQAQRKKRLGTSKNPVSVAELLDPWYGTTEKVGLNATPKSKEGEFRPTAEFGLENTALQIMVRDVLNARGAFSEYQTQFKGGVPEAIKRVRAALESGKVYALTCDLQNCFGSFQEEGLKASLPLPKEVTEKVVMSKGMSFSPMGILNQIMSTDEMHELCKGDVDDHISEFLIQARSGIPQGSVCSPVVAETILAQVFGQVVTSCEVVSYADNTIILGTDENAVCETFKALRSAFEAHLAGPLSLMVEGHFQPGDPIQFLGVMITLKGGVVSVDVLPSKVLEIREKLKTLRKKIRDPKKTIRHRQYLLSKYIQTSKGWCSTYAGTESVKLYETEFRKKLEQCVQSCVEPELFCINW